MPNGGIEEGDSSQCSPLTVSVAIVSEMLPPVSDLAADMISQCRVWLHTWYLRHVLAHQQKGLAPAPAAQPWFLTSAEIYAEAAGSWTSLQPAGRTARLRSCGNASGRGDARGDQRSIVGAHGLHIVSFSLNEGAELDLALVTAHWLPHAASTTGLGNRSEVKLRQVV